MSFFDQLFGGGRQEGFSDLEEQLRQAQQQAQAATRRGEGFLDPFRTGGVQALSSLQQLLGQDPT